MKRIYYEVIYEENGKEYMTTNEYPSEEGVRQRIENMLSLEGVEVKGVLKIVYEDEFIPFDDF
jgi:hypothetical protein